MMFQTDSVSQTNNLAILLNRFPARLALMAMFAALFAAPSTAVAVPLWKQLVPKKRVAADPNADYTLQQQNGPWLIFACSFSGPEGEAQARDLVLELRREYNMPAFYYGKTFSQAEGPGKGLDAYGGTLRRKYQRGNAVVQHAVLVGEFPSLEDSLAQKTLAKVKSLQPESLSANDPEQTHQALAEVRQNVAKFLKSKAGEKAAKGPMGHAFLVRNLLLPKEYFVPTGIDRTVAKMNNGVEYSLLDCRGKYTVKVATFRGRTSLEGANDERNKQTRAASLKDPLVVGAEKAQRLVLALRSRDWPAYVFHDRHESYVAVGSFEQMQALPDGRLLPADRDAQVIIDTFGAAKPHNLFNRPAEQDLAKEKQVKAQFARQFSGGQAAQGFYPKRFIGIPFDIQPTPIAVPKRAALSADYARR